jgi:phosphodiesterase/alkaline phosphatase D-like protein
LLKQRQLFNTIVVTGDVHQSFVLNGLPDSVELDAEPVATDNLWRTDYRGANKAPYSRTHCEC